MDVKSTYIYYKKISLVLIFFSFLCASCKKDSKPLEAEIIYLDGRAIAVQYEKAVSDPDSVHIYLDGHTDTPVLGLLKTYDDAIEFEPVIPFSEGKTYVLYQNNELLTRFTIDTNNEIEAPELIAIYPTSEEVPENLLKMYFQFSKPMQEVDNALNYITVFDESDGKVVDVFLELPTELWNKEHTRLTLWLDPGRIKTDLIPNKEKGLPIISGHTYKITISSDWKDSNGVALQSPYIKQFNVAQRDSKQPAVSDWSINALPDQLEINFNEPMDAVLAKEVFRIKNDKNEILEGRLELTNNEQSLVFKPKIPFLSGSYTIEVASKLEDLAGNNLNHLFDNDLAKGGSKPYSEYKTVSFTID